MFSILQDFQGERKRLWQTLIHDDQSVTLAHLLFTNFSTIRNYVNDILVIPQSIFFPKHNCHLLKNPQWGHLGASIC